VVGNLLLLDGPLHLPLDDLHLLPLDGPLQQPFSQYARPQLDPFGRTLRSRSVARLVFGRPRPSFHGLVSSAGTGRSGRTAPPWAWPGSPTLRWGRGGSTGSRGKQRPLSLSKARSRMEREARGRVGAPSGSSCAACGAPEEVLVLHLGPLFEFPDGVLQDSPSSLWQTASW